MAKRRDSLRGLFGRLEAALREIADHYTGEDPFNGKPLLAVIHDKRPENEHALTLRCCDEWWLEIGISDKHPEDEDGTRTYRGLYVASNLARNDEHFASLLGALRGLRETAEGGVEFTRWNDNKRRPDDTMDMLPFKVESLVVEFLRRASADAFYAMRAYNPL